MGYADLYDFCQGFEPHIKRNLVKDKVLELTGTERLSVVKTELDVAVCRGFYVSARNTEHRLVKQCGGDVIVLARELNRCWQRFVFTKELMHLFDGANEATDSGDKLETLLSEFGTGSPLKRSLMMDSEVKCFWRAMACLCPENLRLQLKDQRDGDQIDDYSIALTLRIPEQHVPKLFSIRYPDILEIVKHD